MAKIKMTKDRKKCGVPEHKAGDTTRAKNPATGSMKTYTFVKEKIFRDDDGFIIGVSTHWQ